MGRRSCREVTKHAWLGNERTMALVARCVDAGLVAFRSLYLTFAAEERRLLYGAGGLHNRHFPL